MLQIPKTRRDILYLWTHSTRHYRGRTPQVTNQQSIHHARPSSSQISIEEYFKGSTSWKLWNHKNSRNTRDYLGSAKKLKYGMNVEHYFENEKCQMRMHEQGYSQSDIDEFVRMANEKWTHVVPSYERLTTEAYRGSCNPIKEEAATQQRPKNTLNTFDL